MLLRSATLAKWGFSHGFSTRKGGVSPPPYDTCDFAMLRDPEALRENLARFGQRVGFDPARLYQATQVHGAAVLEAGGDAASARAVEADAVVASAPGDAAAVRVADCVPVLVADPATGRVAAIHAGWKGVVGRVVEAGLRSLGGGAERVAAIGPCIGSCCFEVSTEVGRAIEAAAGAPGVRAPDHAPGKCKVDLRAAVRAQLVALGLDDANVEDVPPAEGCTRCEAEWYYSFRRDGDASGRLLAAIVAGRNVDPSGR